MYAGATERDENPRGARDVIGLHPVLAGRRELFLRFLKFSVVGGSGVFVDMGVFFLLADRRMAHLDISSSKVLAAEIAIVNNFLWNELWTFRDLAAGARGSFSRTGRFLKFNAICLGGIALNVLLLNVEARVFGINMYVANLIAILCVSIWNFWMNLRFGWNKS